MARNTILNVLFGLLVGLSGTGCRGNLLGTPSSVNELTFSALQSPAGAANGFLGALQLFNASVAGEGSGTPWLYYEGLLSDELTTQVSGNGPDFLLDGRYTAASDTVVQQGPYTVPPYSGADEEADAAFENLLYARSNLLLVVAPLANFESSVARSMLGEAYGLAAYAELFLAEDFCAGVTLDQALPGGGYSFESPLSSDSLLAVAISHFDSALKYAYQNDTVIDLASVGRGRAWLDRGRFDSAAPAVAAVPLNFAYNVTTATNTNVFQNGNSYELGINLWTNQFYPLTYGGCIGQWNVSDREGGVGMNFVSATDRRLVLVPGGETCDDINFSRLPLSDTTFYYPIKFGPPGQSINIPIATGIEAALIQAEAAFAGGAGSASAMLMALQHLRANSAGAGTYLQLDTGVAPMSPDSLNATGAEAVSILFRERAFWLYGTGTRLGDMRREARQYSTLLGGPQAAINAVYPNGIYGPWQMGSALSNNPVFVRSYGSDVVMALPSPYWLNRENRVDNNPQYQGCITSTQVP